MNDDTIQDLKQFITATMSQQASDLRQDFSKLEARVDGLDKSLSQKIEDLDTKFDTVLEVVGERFDNHEQRITKLEQATA